MNFPRYILAHPNSDPHKMGLDWARCQRMINHEQLRYEQLKDFATRYNFQAVVTDALSAFRAVEQVLIELSILQKKYLLHLNPSDLKLPFIRFLLRWSFSIGGKAKLNTLLRELQGYNNTIERTLALCCHPPRSQTSLQATVSSTHPWSPDPHPQSPNTNTLFSSMRTRSRIASGSRPLSPREHHASCNIAADNHRDNAFAYSTASTTSVSQPLSSTPSHRPTHFSNYSSRSIDRSRDQVSSTISRPTPTPYTRASTPQPTPFNVNNIPSTSWFGSTGSYRSRERDDNCSGSLQREYSSCSTRD